MITISAFRWVPEFARGQVRDLRVRWALEEAGLPYQSRLLEQGDQDKAATVLRILHHTDIVSSDKQLGAYVERCTARPAFERALAAQMGDFRAAA